MLQTIKKADIIMDMFENKSFAFLGFFSVFSYVYICIHTLYIYVCMYVCMYMCMCMYMYTVYVCMYMCMCMYMYTVYVCMYLLYNAIFVHIDFLD